MVEKENPQAHPAPRLIAADPSARRAQGLNGFEHRFATVNGFRLHYVAGGNPDGETVVLLAGFPQSWFAWRKIIPDLAKTFWVVAPDLPGQGDSDRPIDGYDTQTLATTINSLLQQLDIARCALVGHDVGAWVAYTYAALFGDQLDRLVLMDSGIPGVTLPDASPTAPDKAWRTWHFAFHVIPDLPEMLITGREREYLDWFLRRKAANPETFSDADLDEYLRVFLKEGGLRAGLAYYRSAALSAEQNRVLAAKRKLRMPVLALSSDQGSVADMATPLHAYADNVLGGSIAHCGHFLPEEQPEAVIRELAGFLGRS